MVMLSIQLAPVLLISPFVMVLHFWKISWKNICPRHSCSSNSKVMDGRLSFFQTGNDQNVFHSLWRYEELLPFWHLLLQNRKFNSKKTYRKISVLTPPPLPPRQHQFCWNLEASECKMSCNFRLLTSNDPHFLSVWSDNFFLFWFYSFITVVVFTCSAWLFVIRGVITSPI